MEVVLYQIYHFSSNDFLAYILNPIHEATNDPM
jgi:hypothetical protein